MTLRFFVLFVHIVSAMGLAGALAIEGASLARNAAGGNTGARILGPVAMLSTLVSGMYLVHAVWGWRAAWIDVALATLVLVVVVGVAALRIARGRPSVMRASLAIRTALFVGIVFLMTVKPGMAESLGAIAIALSAGLVVGVAMVRGSAGAGVADRANVPA